MKNYSTKSAFAISRFADYSYADEVSDTTMMPSLQKLVTKKITEEQRRE